MDFAMNSDRIFGYNKEYDEFYTNIIFPIIPIPCFSDAKLGDYKSELANYP